MSSVIAVLGVSGIHCTVCMEPSVDSYLDRDECSVKKGKGRYSSSWEPNLRATRRHLPYGIIQCYLPPDTSERAPPNPSHAGWYSIYLPLRDGRLSWPSWLDSAPVYCWMPTA